MSLELKNYCKSISNHLLVEAKYSKSGIYWDHGYIHPNDLSILNGQSGILLFLTELYKTTKNQKILDIIYESGRWIKAKNSYMGYQPGFFSGSLGTLFSLFQLYRVTGEEEFLSYILEKLQDKNDTHVPPSNGLSFGVSGEILSYLFFLEELKILSLTKKIESLLNVLLKTTNRSSLGTFWEDNIGLKNNLSFMSGNLGIHFTLFTLNHKFKVISLKDILLESERFILKNYQQYNSHLSFLDRCYLHVYLNSYFKASVKRKTPELYDSNKIAINAANIPNSVAEGKSGLGLLLLENSKISSDEVHYNQAFQLSNVIIKEKCKTKKYSTEFKNVYDNLTFFDGITGTGYFLSKVLTSSAHKPSQSYNDLVASNKYVFDIKPKYRFNHELSLHLNKPEKKYLKMFSKRLTPLEIDSVREFSAKKKNYNELINDVILHAKDCINRKFLFHDFSSIVYEKRKYLNSDNIEYKLKGIYRVSPFSMWLTSKKKDNILIVKTSVGVVHFDINETSFQILNIILKNNNLKKQMIKFGNQVGGDEMQFSSKIEEFYLDQLTEFIKNEIVLCKNQ